MSSTLLAGHWGLCVPSSKPLEVLSVPAGLSGNPRATRWDRQGAGGRGPGFKSCCDSLIGHSLPPDYKMYSRL